MGNPAEKYHSDSVGPSLHSDTGRRPATAACGGADTDGVRLGSPDPVGVVVVVSGDGSATPVVPDVVSSPTRCAPPTRLVARRTALNSAAIRSRAVPGFGNLILGRDGVAAGANASCPS